ncbi:MAG: acetate--CoA ligase family protein [Anaerolineae bacterium]
MGWLLGALPLPKQDLTPLLRAKAVAIVGLSGPGRFGGQVYANLRDFGYQGRIYGVNPRYDSLYEQPCYPSLSDLPDRPDCAILAVSNQHLLETLQAATAMQIPAAVIFASAYLTFNVQGSNVSLQDQLAEIARASGMVVCGPNCMGFFALAERLVVCGYESNPAMPAGHVTLISHSGSIWDALLQNNRGVHFNYAISSGNEMVTTLADYMHFALADPSTRVIGLFLETVRDPETFRAALAQAAEQDVPVVALKVGRSERGARLAQAHSGALAGADAVYEALFAYYGVRRVKSPDELMDTLELLAAGLRCSTRYITAVCDSGGERSMLVDLAESEGVEFAPLAAETTTRLAQVLEPGLEPVNPLDAWGTGHEYQRLYQESFQTLDADPLTGLNVFAVDVTNAGDLTPEYVKVALELKALLRHPLIFLTHLTAAAAETPIAQLRQAGIPVLLGTETGLRAIRHVLEYSEFQRRSRGAEEQGGRGDVSRTTPHASRVTRAKLRQLLQDAAGPLDEFASKEILRLYGIPTPDEALATSLVEARLAAEAIGYPVAVKTAAGVLHKSDRDGVRLHLGNETALTEVYRDFERRFGPHVLVQQMVPPGAQLLLGLVNDAQFGPLLALGSGGILVEVVRDYRLLLLPTTPETVRETLLSLHGAVLLRGVRGHSPANIEAVVEVAMRLAALAADLGDLIAEVDINPLIALPAGAVAVDALIVPKHHM